MLQPWLKHVVRGRRSSGLGHFPLVCASRARCPPGAAAMALSGLLELIVRSPSSRARPPEVHPSGSGPTMGEGPLRHFPSLSNLLLAGNPNRDELSEPDQTGEEGLTNEGLANFPLLSSAAAFQFPPLPPSAEQLEEELVPGFETSKDRSKDLSWGGQVCKTVSSMRAWMSPRKSKQACPPTPAGGEHGRKGLPQLARKEPVSKKDKLVLALGAARTLKRRGLKHPSIEKSFAAASSVDSKNAKKRTISKILEVLKGNEPVLPLSQEVLKALASALQEGGYKAGESYLIEAKLWHIEEGHSWGDTLDRAFKQCKRALARGQGPKKMALEVGAEARAKPSKLNFSQSGKAVKFGAELFVFCTTWMLREIELGILTSGDLLVDHINKKVTLHLRLSKMDQEGQGVRRTLQCLCRTNLCDKECPYHVTCDLVNKVEKFNGSNTAVAMMKNKAPATKAQIIKTWRWLFGQGVSGHSGRRSGALSYIRAGWSITQVAHLGRWKSNAILAYAEEALEQMPANMHILCPTLDSKGNQTLENKLLSEEEISSWKAQLRKEMDELKGTMDKKGKENEEQINNWAKFYKENPGTLPRKLQSISGKVTHLNLARSTSSPPVTWRTACGWAYYGSHFCFVEPETTITCQKCLLLCAETQ